MNWYKCKVLTCSVLPVGRACNLNCKFCFSKSSISSLVEEKNVWTDELLHRYFKYSKDKGATRLVITGGGEPLLQTESVKRSVEIGREYFDETALFTNGSYLDRDMVEALKRDLSYICYSRHHWDDELNNQIMGKKALTLKEFFRRVDGKIKIRATCVLSRGFIENELDATVYMDILSRYGVKEYTFKHTYQSYDKSLYSKENEWVKNNQINLDGDLFFCGEGEVIASLPWGPKIRKIGEKKVCYYYEPSPTWELENCIARSLNLMANGEIYASLEDTSSLLSM